MPGSQRCCSYDRGSAPRVELLLVFRAAIGFHSGGQEGNLCLVTLYWSLAGDVSQ